MLNICNRQFINKAIACFFLSFIMSGLAHAQGNQIPQVYTPQAAELGKYGKVPVSYFNGLPNITIPLTELKGKNYHLPVYLSYHAGGNKPDEHAGPVGLGWSLHAGGCINRIVNGLKDEEDGAEFYFYKQTHQYGYHPNLIVEPELPIDNDINPMYLGPGLFYNWDTYDSTDWSDLENLDAFARNDDPLDYEPDEFIVNLEGLNASFYFDGPNGIRIVSQSAEEFKVEYELGSNYEITLISEVSNSLKAHLFTYIKKLVLTKGDGTRYTFGGDLSSIEFCYQQDKHLNEQRLVGTANTWYLSKIEIPGGETIQFSYQKRGFPIVKKDVHNKLYVHYTSVLAWETGGITSTEEVYTSESDYSNISLAILNPSYLTRIENNISGDYLNFSLQKTDELESDVNMEEFTAVMGAMTGLNRYSFINGENYHMGITDIAGPTKLISLYYRGLKRSQSVVPLTSVILDPEAPPAKERLRLEKVCFKERQTDNTDQEYLFSYDTLSLPHDYNSKFTDHWGYYTNLRHHDVLRNRTIESDTFYKTTLNNLMDQYRAPNARRMQAEILKEITFPTGGIRKFEYEPHTYQKIVSCFNPVTQRYDFAVRLNAGMAGGLRIKSITDSLSVNAVERRTFSYNDSGILCGKPLYGAIGRSRLTHTYQDSGLFGDPISLEIGFTEVSYRIGSELYLNQLSPTSGNHVTYGKVTENFSDGSSITYHYSDHTTVPDSAPLWTESNISCSLLQDPVTSMQLGRGLLLQLDYKDAQGNLVKQETMTYAQPSANDYLLSISKKNPAPSGSLKRVSVNRIAYYHPRLESKSVTTWQEEGAAAISETETYSYNNHRRITARTRSRGNDNETEHILYAEDLTSGIFPAMTSAGYGAIPIEQLSSRNGTIYSADLTTWRQDSTYHFYVPSEIWKAHLDSSLPVTQWQLYNGVTVSQYYGVAPEMAVLGYDAHRNITEVKDHGRHHGFFLWDTGGMNMMAASDAGDIFYQDFESHPQAVSGGYLSDKAWSGVFVLSFVPQSGVPYVVDYRLKDGDNWLYTRAQYTGAGMQIGAANTLIDHVRLYPEGSSIETYTFQHPGLLRSQTDTRGITQSYDYDWDRRLETIRDNDGAAEKSWQYHYRNGTFGENYISQTTWFSADGTSSYTEETRFDGFGRQSASVQKLASTLRNDIIQSFSYDGKGRPVRTSIPWPTRTTQLPANQHPYSETVYDASPLDRIKKQYGPGAAWRNGDHAVKYTYLSNTAGNTSLRYCRRYTVSFATDGTAVVSSTGFWPAGALEVLKTVTEDGAVNFIFKNMWGQEVLSRTDGLDTYYVYDDWGRLTAVLPPTLSEVLSSETGQVISETACPEIRQYAYLYRYDARGRCIAKRLPGCTWIYYIYDDADRLVFEQDGIDRAAGKWKFTLRDAKGRECIQGAALMSLNPFTNPLAGINMDVSRSYPYTTEGMYGYTLSSFTINRPTILSVCWWDDYSFLGKWTLPQSDNPAVAFVAPEANEPYGQFYTTSATGLQTGSLSKVLGINTGNQYLWKVNYYDSKGRIVQTRESHLAGRSIISRLGYDYSGKVMARENTYNVLNQNLLTECYSYTYDNCGRPLQTIHAVNSGTPVVLRNLSYDTVGRLMNDTRNGNANLATHYAYDIRSQLTSLEVGPSGGTFMEALDYISSSHQNFTPRWGGDIASKEWSVGSSMGEALHRYDYTYDNLARLLQANHSSADPAFHFSRSYTYDNEGNLLSVQRPTGTDTITHFGHRLGVTVDTPVLEFSDAAIEPVPEEPGPSSGLDPEPVFAKDTLIFLEPLVPEPALLLADNYEYDAMGKLIHAYPEGIMDISYNILNRPQRITMLHGETVSILYGANGSKLNRTVDFPFSLPGTPRTYMGSLVMEENNPSLLLVDGGYMTFQQLGGQLVGIYHFFVTDHQGNIQAITNENGVIEKIYHYDPYGEIVYESPSAGEVNRYKYSGKEWDNKHSAYDFEARMYMPPYAHFTTMDPLCEKYYSLSPYAYCAGNPVNLVDPDGREIWIRANNSNEYVIYSQGHIRTVNGSDYSGSDWFINKIKTSLNELMALKDEYISYVLKTLEMSDKRHIFVYHNDYEDATRALGEMDSSFANEGKSVGSWIMLSFNKDIVDGVVNNNTLTVAHELSHSFDFDQGKMKGEVPWEKVGIPPTEIRAVNFENRVRVRLGMKQRRRYKIPITGEFLENPWRKKKIQQ